MGGLSSGKLTQQYIEHPPRYKLRDTVCDTTLLSSSQFRPRGIVSDESEAGEFDLGQSDSARALPPSDLIRAGS